VKSARRRTFAFATAALLSAAATAALAAAPAHAAAERPSRVAAGTFFAIDLPSDTVAPFANPQDGLCINLAVPANAFDNDTDSYVTVYAGLNCTDPIFTVGQFVNTTVGQNYNSIEFTFESIDPPGQ
jgi:hypothetical protein